MKETEILEELIIRHSQLTSAKEDILAAFKILCNCFESGGKLLVCGNGGSAADADHIVGELMKSLTKKRPINNKIKQKLLATSTEKGDLLSANLEAALPAVSLVSHNSLMTAIANDTGAAFVFAQQVMGLGKPNDVLLGISTSGNAENVCNAILTASAIGLKTIGLTGQYGGELKNIAEIYICVAEEKTQFVQELHLPVYHALCLMLEEYFFN